MCDERSVYCWCMCFRDERRFRDCVCSERLERLFNELKAQLMLPGNQLEEIFLLIREMKMGTERNFAIKRFFWKVKNNDDELMTRLSFFVMFWYNDTTDQN